MGILGGMACQCNAKCVLVAEFLSCGDGCPERWQPRRQRVGGSLGDIDADSRIEMSTETQYRHPCPAPASHMVPHPLIHLEGQTHQVSFLSHSRSEITAGGLSFPKRPKEEPPWCCGPSTSFQVEQGRVFELPLISCVALGKLINFSVPHLSLL